MTLMHTAAGNRTFSDIHPAIALLKTFSHFAVFSSNLQFLIFLRLTSKFRFFIIMINPMNRRVAVHVHQRAGTEWESGGTAYSEPHL